MKKLLSKQLIVTLVLTFSAFGAFKLQAEPLLNGVATHAELGQEQFIAGLFTSTLSDSSGTILSTQEEKRIQVRVLAPRLSSRRFRRMWIEGMAINASPAELEKHANDMADFSNMVKIKMIAGDIFSVERREDAVRVSINSVMLGEIEDPQFFDLLLRTWIGPVPLSSEFRDALLTAGSIKPGPLTRFESTRPSDTRITAIESAVTAKLAGSTSGNSQTKQSSSPKVAVAAPKIEPEIAAPPQISAPSGPEEEEPTKIALAPPTLDDSSDETTEEPPEVAETPEPPKATPAPVKVVLAPQEEALDESIFDEEDDEVFSAESLLKEQLYYSQLAKFTHKYIEYPQRAWDRGREGNIRLRVTINRKGKVKKTELLEEARYKSLNKAARIAVKNASPYPAIPEEISGDDYSFTFRIAFKIK
ncbi:MAG: TonB family protein [Agarilytica sp.]